MSSTIVHCAFAGLLAAGLLGEYVDARAVAVVLHYCRSESHRGLVGLVRR